MRICRSIEKSEKGHDNAIMLLLSTQDTGKRVERLSSQWVDAILNIEYASHGNKGLQNGRSDRAAHSSALAMNQSRSHQIKEI